VSARRSVAEGGTVILTITTTDAEAETVSGSIELRGEEARTLGEALVQKATWADEILSKNSAVKS
jgi:hypothetical protein